MAHITLRILEGADRGRIYADLDTPVTIGREEGNSVQLNDERVSRFHLKIQEDHEKLVVTDLESTNGTKINGEPAQLRILRFGDLIAVGRSVLLYGSREEIAARLAEMRKKADGNGGGPDGPASLEYELNWTDDPNLRISFQAAEPPELPARLSAGQAAQLSELLEYIHLRMRDLIASVRSDPEGDRVTLELRQWQHLLDIQSRLADYLRSIGEPREK